MIWSDQCVAPTFHREPDESKVHYPYDLVALFFPTKPGNICACKLMHVLYAMIKVHVSLRIWGPELLLSERRRENGFFSGLRGFSFVFWGKNMSAPKGWMLRPMLTENVRHCTETLIRSRTRDKVRMSWIAFFRLKLKYSSIIFIYLSLIDSPLRVSGVWNHLINTDVIYIVRLI